MFTGIVEKVGQITAVSPQGETTLLRIATSFGDLELGESVAVNGCCLTVTESTADGEALFFVSQETLRLTNLGSLTVGSRVNLERALALGSRLSGHWVQGHVDGVGHIVQAATDLVVEIPAELAKYCIHKGSICLDGISLTLNEVAGNRVRFTIIPHTWNHTRLHTLRAGDPVNVETDLIAKHVERLLECRS